ncbi:hypothetical protein BDN70DRAFT_396085 [Pholiota conissans]|uniref:Uncharacterized protein n=1 Tax=Pholiota conissans TaxID=109636 RepID=A0A9P5YT93_9AGAR|nr:hypothetical protein BDN70DRAFT_396085 [Pholiota conissans]
MVLLERWGISIESWTSTRVPMASLSTTPFLHTKVLHRTVYCLICSPADTRLSTSAVLLAVTQYPIHRRRPCPPPTDLSPLRPSAVWSSINPPDPVDICLFSPPRFFGSTSCTYRRFLFLPSSSSAPPNINTSYVAPTHSIRVFIDHRLSNDGFRHRHRKSSIQNHSLLSSTLRSRMNPLLSKISFSSIHSVHSPSQPSTLLSPPPPVYGSAISVPSISASIYASKTTQLVVIASSPIRRSLESPSPLPSWSQYSSHNPQVTILVVPSSKAIKPSYTSAFLSLCRAMIKPDLNTQSAFFGPEVCSLFRY